MASEQIIKTIATGQGKLLRVEDDTVIADEDRSNYNHPHGNIYFVFTNRNIGTL